MLMIGPAPLLLLAAPPQPSDDACGLEHKEEASGEVRGVGRGGLWLCAAGPVLGCSVAAMHA
jgi:hypothetical protein